VRENIVPLVNIVFLLLIFFMLAGTLRDPQVLEVEPPETAPGLPASEESRTLSLDREGGLAVDGLRVEREALGDALSADSAFEPGRTRLRLRADRHARAEHLLPLLETLARLGFDDVALVTRDAASAQ
jgi:biopolymer transport protein ExbD